MRLSCWSPDPNPRRDSATTPVPASHSMTAASVSDVRGEMRGRLSRVDVLRAIAVLLVMVHHMYPPPEYAPRFVAEIVAFARRPGWIGVDLFFVLSGFLVSGLLFREHQLYGDLRVGRFLIRRGFK